MVGAGVLLALITASPVFAGNSLTLYARVFACCYRSSTAMWLCTVWLLQVARDAIGAGR
ncbi:MAG: hypothetical protein H0X39_00615 [Actinobacteria bacterium]|nr:hypothetical protein [Actinomycetota bacterium]